MTAVTADRVAKKWGADASEATHPIKTSVTLYLGTLVNLNATGRLVDGANTAAQTFGGIVTDFPDASATGNTAGTVRAKVEWGRRVSLNISTALRTNTKLGAGVHVLDNVTVCGTTTAGTALKRIVCGTLMSFDASDKSTGWVELRSGGAATVALG